MMSQPKSLKLNFIMNAILTMSSFVFPLITFPYVSRILLPSGTGKVSFAMSLISYFSMFAQLGIPTYGIRACAKVRDNREELTRTVHELLVINLVMDVLSYAILIIALLFVPRLQEDRTLYVVVSFTIILTSIGMEWLYKALEQYIYITIRSIIFKFVALVALFFLVHDQGDYVIYGAISIFAASASNILNFINVQKYVDMKPVGKYNFKRHFKAIGVFFAMSCTTTIYTHLDTVMLGFMATDEDVGYYDVAVKIKNILVGIITSLGAVLLPRSSYYVEHGMMDKFKEITRKAMNFVFILAAPLMLYFIFYAGQWIYFLLGSAYGGSIMPTKIIMPTLLLIGLTNILGIQILVPQGREEVVLYSEIAGAVVDLILNFFLIPLFASSGAAIGTLVAEVMVLIIQFVALRKEVGYAFSSVSYWKILLGLLLGIACSSWSARFGFGNFLTLALSACLFFGTYGIVLLVTKEKRVVEILWQIFGKVKDRLNGKRNV